MLTHESIKKHLESYPTHVPPNLHALDALRFSEIPTTLAQRKKDDDTFLTRGEVCSLMEWKLKHGTFRPKLASLVASNEDEDIVSLTKKAFTIYEADNHTYSKAIKPLTELKGIGPATASLLLSCYDPGNVPFFLDELFRYVMWEDKIGCGWDRKIKYTMKEYTEMFEKVQEILECLEEDGGKVVSALDLEKVAYVLGKEAKAAGNGDIEGADVEGQGTGSSSAMKPDRKRKRPFSKLQKKSEWISGPGKKRKSTASGQRVSEKDQVTELPQTLSKRTRTGDMKRMRKYIQQHLENGNPGHIRALKRSFSAEDRDDEEPNLHDIKQFHENSYKVVGDEQIFEGNTMSGIELYDVDDGECDKDCDEEYDEEGYSEEDPENVEQDAQYAAQTAGVINMVNIRDTAILIDDDSDDEGPLGGRGLEGHKVYLHYRLEEFPTRDSLRWKMQDTVVQQLRHPPVHKQFTAHIATMAAILRARSFPCIRITYDKIALGQGKPHRSLLSRTDH